MRLKQGCRLFWVALVAFVLDRATKVWSLTLEGGAELPLARGKYDEIHRAFIERN